MLFASGMFEEIQFPQFQDLCEVREEAERKRFLMEEAYPLWSFVTVRCHGWPKQSPSRKATCNITCWRNWELREKSFEMFARSCSIHVCLTIGQFESLKLETKFILFTCLTVMNTLTWIVCVRIVITWLKRWKVVRRTHADSCLVESLGKTSKQWKNHGNMLKYNHTCLPRLCLIQACFKRR